MYNGADLDQVGSMEQARFYADQNALKSLIQTSKSDSDNLRRAAEEFESLFINMMFKSMRQANAVFSEGNPFESQETQFFQEMLDNQLSVEMSKGGGIGLSDMLMRQLSPLAENNISGDDVKDSGAGGNAVTSAQPDQQTSALYLKSGQRMEAARLQAPAKVQGQLLYGDSESVSAYAQDTSANRPFKYAVSVLGGVGVTQVTEVQTDISSPSYNYKEQTQFNSPEDFVAAMWPHAQKAGRALGVDPRALVAQAALETGWGKHIMGDGIGGSSKNLFGIKASAGQARAVGHNTTEFVAGTPRKVRAQFRTYDSFGESFDDYVALISRHQRYEQARVHAHDPKAFMAALQSAGYATDPEYANKVYRVFQGIDKKLVAVGLASDHVVAMSQSRPDGFVR